jgi:deoxyribonuclease-4
MDTGVTRMKIGFHMPIARGFGWMQKEAEGLGCEVIQMFVKNPRSWAKKTWLEEEIEAFRPILREFTVVAHLSYLPNLAKIDQDERNIEGFIHEAELCTRLGVKSMVVHCGSRQEKEEGIKMTARAINTVTERYDITILLENAAGQGSSIGSSFVELAGIFEGVTHRERVFLCLDTAHLFEAGNDVRLSMTWDGIVKAVTRYFGPGKIMFFHLNDSKTGLGSRVDRHWHIGKGEIGTAAFKIIVNDKRFAHLAGVMETPKTGNMDEENMKTIKSLLPPLMSRSLS